MKRPSEVVAVVSAMGAGLAVAAVALSGFGGDAAFLERQQAARPANASEIERLLLTTPSPYAPQRRDAVEAICVSRGSGELRNPWRCTVGYESGREARFALSLRFDGSFRADHLGGSGALVGCCVALTPSG